MNIFSILISIMMPVVLITYISVDLLRSKKTKNTARVIYMSSDPMIGKQDHDPRPNDGAMISNDEIIENAAYMLEHYANDM